MINQEDKKNIFRKNVGRNLRSEGNNNQQYNIKVTTLDWKINNTNNEHLPIKKKKNQKQQVWCDNQSLKIDNLEGIPRIITVYFIMTLDPFEF